MAPIILTGRALKAGLNEDDAQVGGIDVAVVGLEDPTDQVRESA